MTDEQMLQAMQGLLAEERAYAKTLLVEQEQRLKDKIEDSIRPLRKSIVKLEDMPRQIKLIAEGHAGLVERLDKIEIRLDRIENQLETAVIVKAAR